MRFRWFSLAVLCTVMCAGPSAALSARKPQVPSHRAARKPAAKPGTRTARKTAAKPTTPTPERLEVFPPRIHLERRRASHQIVVTGYYGGVPRDVTHLAKYSVGSQEVIQVRAGRVTPTGDGQTALAIRLAGKTVRVPVTVSGFTQPDPVQFKFETLAVLTKQGCSGGSCHGSPHGKGGFSLSLFGYDPTIDRISLTRDGFNRRLNVLDPDESLILKKPLLEIPHVGGKRLRKKDTAHRILRDWVYQGAKADLPKVEVERIELHPGSTRVLQAPYRKQQLSVLAYLSDGTVRDVTPIASYESSQPDVATVDSNGLVTGHGRGQAAISVRYLDRLEAFYVTVIEDVPNFVWNNPPENNFVDRLVHRKLRQLQFLPSGDATDEVFLRRVYLDLTGLPPTPEQARRFLQDPAPNKRARLIDALLETEEHARFWALKKADLMRVSPARLPNGRAERFAAWITEAFRRNMPYDRFAREILTASGNASEVAAANYFLAIPSSEERTEMTAQIFMGTRVECAKCHNHPYESWTMRDYYSIAAVFARTQADNGIVRLANSGEVRHPTTNETLPPWGMDGVQPDPKLDRRVVFAQWLTRPGNPYFARVEVNRIWADLFGRGIVDPVDDFRSSNPPSNVGLLDALAKEFESHRFDRRHIIRLICNSRTYQRSTATNPFNERDETLFSHARARLLTAEQLKDAIGMVTRTLEPATALPARLDDLRRQVEARTANLNGNYPQWLAKATANVAERPMRAGAWYEVGPFSHDNVEAALNREFGPEKQPVDLNAQFAEDRKWQLQPQFRDDGSPVEVSGTGRQVHYLYRRIHARQPHALTVQFQPQDAARIWLNGKPLRPEAIRRNETLKLDLQPGDNHLLVKLVNDIRPSILRFRITDPAVGDGGRRLPPHVVELVSLPEAERTPEQNALLRQTYLELDDTLNSLKQQIARREARLDYATQRPYPEKSAFTAAFGQPERETACTCERLNSPTLLQALELLNGGMAFRAASTGAAQYAELSDEQVVEQVYLSAFSRFPSAKERAAARGYLQKASNRDEAITDFLWTIINTQEFLFQH